MMIVYDGKTIEISDEFSRKNFTGWNFSDRNDLNDIVIEGSCFSQEKPDSKVFPDNMTGVSFITCNLDNCFIPDGNTVIGGSQKRFSVQNDGEDWIVDDQNNPVEPINKKAFEKLGLSIDPVDIPQEKQDLSVIHEKLEEIEIQKADAIVDAILAVEENL